VPREWKATARLSLFSDVNSHRKSIAEEGLVNDLKRMFALGKGRYPTKFYVSVHSMLCSDPSAPSTDSHRSDFEASDVTHSEAFAEAGVDVEQGVRAVSVAAEVAGKANPAPPGVGSAAAAEGSDSATPPAPSIPSHVFKLVYGIGSVAVRAFGCGDVLASATLEDDYGRHNFDEMCKAISVGHLSLGIIVTHPKVLSSVHRIDDDDYLSDDEHLLALGNRSLPQSYVYQTRRGAGREDLDEHEEFVDVSVFSKRNTASSPVGMPVVKKPDGASIDSLTAIYGEKKDEISKFYDILRSAELSSQASSPAASSAVRERDTVPDKASSLKVEASQSAVTQRIASPVMENSSLVSSGLTSFSSENRSRSNSEDSAEMEENPVISGHSPEGQVASKALTVSARSDSLRKGVIANKSPRAAVKKAAGQIEGSANEASARSITPESPKLTDKKGSNSPFAGPLSSPNPLQHLMSLNPLNRRSITGASGRASVTSRRSVLTMPSMKELDMTIIDEGPSSTQEQSLDADGSVGIYSQQPRMSDIQYEDSYPNRSISRAIEAMNEGFGVMPSMVSYSRFVPPHVIEKRAEFHRKYDKLDLAPSCFQIAVNAWKLVAGSNTLVSEAHLARVSQPVVGVSAPSAAVVSAASSPSSSVAAENYQASGLTSRETEAFDYRNRDTLDLASPALRVSLDTRTNEHENRVSVSSNPGPSAAISEVSPRPEASDKSAPEGIWQCIKDFMWYLYFNQFFFWRYVKQICFGRNMSPHGPPVLRTLLGLLILCLSCVDLGLFVFVCVEFYCLWNITCESHLAVILPIIIFPGALLFSPLSGIVAVLLGPSGGLARIHACWSRLALISNAVVISIFVAKGRDNTTIAYIVGCLAGSRVFQCAIIDLYISHIEQIRWTRGWDGLVTSLYADNDKKVDIRGD
jgi:hypothetical protein